MFNFNLSREINSKWIVVKNQLQTINYTIESMKLHMFG